MYGIKPLTHSSRWLSSVSNTLLSFQTYIDFFKNIATTNLAALILASVAMITMYLVKEYINPKVKAKIRMPLPVELFWVSPVVVTLTALSCARVTFLSDHCWHRLLSCSRLERALQRECGRHDSSRVRLCKNMLPVPACNCDAISVCRHRKCRPFTRSGRCTTTRSGSRWSPSQTTSPCRSSSRGNSATTSTPTRSALVCFHSVH